MGHAMFDVEEFKTTFNRQVGFLCISLKAISKSHDVSCLSNVP